MLSARSLVIDAGVHIGVVHSTLHCRCRTVFQWWPYVVRITRIPLGVFFDRKEAGFALIDRGTWSWGAMAGKFMVWWLLSKQKRQNGESTMDVVEDGFVPGSSVHWGFCCPIGMAVSREQVCKEEAFFREDIINDDKLELMLLALPLRPVFCVGYLFCRIDEEHVHCANHIGACLTKSHGAPDHILYGPFLISSMNA